MRRGMLICFIGIDGSGKTTIAKHLEEYLRKTGKSCRYIWGGWRSFESPLFKPIAKLLRKNLSILSNQHPEVKSNLGVLSYFALLDYILRVFPNLIFSLSRYEYVIMDRYIYDVIISFSLRREPSVPLFRKLSLFFPRPYKVFLIDVPEEIAYSRKDDIPSIKYIANQKNLYLEISKEEGFQIIDGTRDKENLLEMIRKEVVEE